MSKEVLTEGIAEGITSTFGSSGLEQSFLPKRCGDFQYFSGTTFLQFPLVLIRTMNLQSQELHGKAKNCKEFEKM